MGQMIGQTDIPLIKSLVLTNMFGLKTVKIWYIVPFLWNCKQQKNRRMGAFMRHWVPLEFLDLGSHPNKIFSKFNCVICIFSMISKECSIKLCICNQLTFFLKIDVKFGKKWWIFQDIMQY